MGHSDGYNPKVGAICPDFGSIEIDIVRRLGAWSFWDHGQVLWRLD